MAFQPPAASKRQLDGVPFDLAVDFAPDAQRKFGDKDRQKGNKDPSKCKALLRFPAGGDRPDAVFWSSKMAIDTDGPAAGPGRPDGKGLDPSNSGQSDTNLQFADGKGGLPSELIPYIVCCRSSSPAANRHSIPRLRSAIWPSSFSGTRRRRRYAAISAHPTRSARPRSGSTKRCSSRDVPTHVPSATQKASVRRRSMRASSRTYCFLCFRIRHSTRAN